MTESKVEFEKMGDFTCKRDGTILQMDKSVTLFLNNFGSTHFEDYGGKNIFNYIKSFEKIFKNDSPGFYLKKFHCIELELNNEFNNYFFDIFLNDSDNFEISVTNILLDSKVLREIYFREELLNSVINLIPDIVYRLDKKGRLIFISESIQNYGYFPAELLGKDILEIIHPDDREKAKFKLKERRRWGRSTRSFDVRLIAKNKDIITFRFEDLELNDSQFFSVSSEGLYEKNDNGYSYIGTQGIARDITKMVVYDYSIKNGKRKFNQILESLNDGYYESDFTGEIRYVNDALSKILDYSKDEILGKKYFDFIAKDDHQMILELFNKVYREDKPQKGSQWKFIKKNGEEIILNGSVSLITDENGKKTGFHGILRDESEKLRLEKNLLKARKLEAIGIFAGGIAHDYNNALTAVLGNLSLAKMELNGENFELEEVLADAEKAAMRIKELTHQLSTFALGGKPVTVLTSIDLLASSVVEQVVSDFTGKVVFDFQENLPKIEVDEFQISSVFENILKNSLKAVKGREGKLIISCKTVDVKEEQSHHEISLQQGKYMLVSFKDNGVGIKEEDTYKIFDPYYTTDEYLSGMGLAISYAIIKRHHGYIDVKSEVGKGSEFLVYFPMQ